MILINSSTQDTMRIFRPFARINVPVGVGCLASVLAKANITAYIIDEQIENNAIALAVEYTTRLTPPYIFGFSVLTAAFRKALITAKHLKELYPDSIVIFGGIHPTALPDEVLSYEYVDIVFRGEADEILPELYRCLKNREDYSRFGNISFRHNGQHIHNEQSSVVIDLDSLPPFPYHLFASEQYELGAIVTSRGCPHKCIYCSNRITTGRRYRYRSAELIADEIKLLYNKYNTRHILFQDDNLVVNKTRLFALLDRIKAEGLENKLEFTFQARGDNVDYQVLRSLYSAGFKNISLGMETASERLMDIIEKGETVAKCAEAVRLAKQLGFHVSATFMFGLPTETHEDRMSCIKLIKDIKIDMPKFNNATPYPGTKFYEIAQRENRLNVHGLYDNFNSVSAITENPFKRVPFSYVPIGSSEDEIRSDILFCHLICYLNINRIKMMFSRSSATKRWFNPGDGLTGKVRRLPALLWFGLILSIKFSQLFFNILFRRNTSISMKELISMLISNEP